MADNLDKFTDEELGRMLRAALRSDQFARRETVSNFEAFCAFLDSVGLGFISSAIKLAAWTWDRVKRIWRSIFG